MAKKPKAPKPGGVNCAAYAEGRQAFKRGYPNSTNPYPSASGANHERTAWYNGWYFEKYEKMFAEMDERKKQAETQ